MMHTILLTLTINDVILRPYFNPSAQIGSWDIQVGQQRKKHGQNCVSIGYIDDKKPKIF